MATSASPLPLKLMSLSLRPRDLLSGASPYSPSFCRTFLYSPTPHRKRVNTNKRLFHATYRCNSVLITSNTQESVVVKPTPRPKRLVVGVTGATGTLLAIRLLEILQALNIETHLIMSKWALATMKYETTMTEKEVRALVTHNYTMKDMSAPPSSGSFQHDGMIIVPCSMKTLAAVRIGYCDDLISRSADVCLKERRKLMLVARETPLSDIHLENMLSLRRAGAIIFPPVPAFYTRPKSIEDLVDQSVGRMLDAFDINTQGFERWTGFRKD